MNNSRMNGQADNKAGGFHAEDPGNTIPPNHAPCTGSGVYNKQALSLSRSLAEGI